MDSTKRYCRQFIESSPINLFLMFSVFANTMILASDGLSPDTWADFLTNLNLAFTVVFTLEMSFKMYGLGLRGYSKDFFNVFDALVVMISLVEVVITFTQGGGSGGGQNAASAFRAIRIFRIFRVLRVTRLLRSLRFMKIIIEVIKGTLK